MSINRYELITRHNPKLSAVDFSSPLSVGNGDFVYTADVTGMQSLAAEYADTFPLCTMAHWGVHTLPPNHPRYQNIENQSAKQGAGVRQGGSSLFLASSATATKEHTEATKRETTLNRLFIIFNPLLSRLKILRLLQAKSG